MRFAFYTYIFTCFFTVLTPLTTSAQDTDLFTIEGVVVDVISDNAVKAKNEAIIEARAQAFEILLGNILSSDEVGFYSETPDSDISTLIQDFEITSEQLGAQQYIGTFTFRFIEGAVRRFLKGTGASFSDLKRDPILVLPYYQQNGRYIMFDQSNPWLSAWQRIDTFKGLVPVLVPLGDIQDIADIGQSHPLQYDEASLTRLAQRYNVRDIIITIAAIDEVSGDVRVYVYSTNGIGVEYVETLKAGSALSEGFDEAVKVMQRYLSDDWKQQTALSAETNAGFIDVTTRFASLAEWVQTKNALDNLSSLETVEILKLSSNTANLRLKFQGSYQRLDLALRQIGLGIQQSQYGLGGQLPLLQKLSANY